MKVSAEMEAEIVRLFHAEKWKVGTIATQLQIHHGVVRRVLTRGGLPTPKLAPRVTVLDPYRGFMRTVLERYPTLRASRLYHMLRERGYTGSEPCVRRAVATMRPRPRGEAYLRLSTLPGEQGQVDWAHFGTMQIGRASRALLAFVMVLSWSRMIFVRFFLGARMPCFLKGHVEAFEAFGGVPRELLYDNLKSAVLERQGDAIRFHPTLLELAAHYRYAPKPCAPGRGNEKGRVERAIRYIRESFFAAREFGTLDELNAHARAWCEGLAADRRWPEDHKQRVRDVFAEERARLLELPEVPFPAEEIVPVSVGKTPYARFDLNDYSVPHTYARRDLTCVASIERVRLCDGATVVADHERCYSRGERLEDPAHIETLAAQKSNARQSRGMGRLHHAAPKSRAFLVLAGERGCNLGSITAQLLGLLDDYGARDLDLALGEVHERGVVHIPAVRQLLEQRRHARGLAPPLAVHLPADPRVRDLVVTPHALTTYDALTSDGEEADDDHGS